MSGFAEIMHYIRTHNPKGVPIAFLHDDVRSVYYTSAHGDKPRKTTVSAFVREAWHKCGGELGSMVSVAPSTSWAPRSTLSQGPLFVYDPLHFEVNSQDIPRCHFRLKCDYEASLLSFLLGHPMHRLGRFSISARHRPRPWL